MNKILTKFLTFSVGLAMAIGVGVALKGNEARGARAATITKTMAQIATANSWKKASGGGTQTCYTSFELDDNIRISTTGNPNCGSFWGSDWRLYQAQSGTFVVTPLNGVTITSMTITFSIQNTGCLATSSGTKKTAYFTSGDAKAVTISSNTTYYVSNTGDASNGQVRVTAISATYNSGSSTYTVTYLGNGNTDGDVPEDGSSYSSGTSVTILGNENNLVKTGYTWSGWTLNAEGTGKVYGPDYTEKYTITANLTLYAKWVESTVEGVFKKLTTSLVEGEYVICSGTTAMQNTVVSGPRIGYKTGVSITSNSIINPLASIVWTISKITVDNNQYWTIYNSTVKKYAAFTGTDGRGTLLDDVTNYAYWLSSGTENYEFTNIGKTGKYLRYNSDVGFASYSKQTGSSLTLYLKHTDHTISYLPNGGTSTMADTVNVVAECSFTAPTNQEFDHWNTEPDDKGTSYNPGVTVEEDVTLYAIWRWIPPSVEINKDEIEFTVGDSTSTTVEATASHISDITYSWQRTAGDDCITLTDTSTSTVTVEPKGERIGLCTLTLTVNGNNGGKAITPIVKTVSIVLKRTPTEGNPYNVQEAIKAIDNNLTVSNVYVRGIVFNVETLDSGSITYDISDDGTEANPFKVYKGKDKNGANFTSNDDVQVGDIVVVKGNICLYSSSTYEFSKDSQRVSYERVTITKIEVETAPTKTKYIYNEDFDPTGLVITVTFSNGDTTDVAYAGHESDFEFSISKVTSSTNVTITYAGETCPQAVTLLTVSSVTGATSYPTSIYVGDSISGSDVTLSVLYSDGKRTGTVQANHVDVDSTKVAASVTATAWYTADESDDNMKTTFNVEVKKVPIYVNVTDEIDLAFTGVSGTSYTSWSNKASDNGAVYSGNNAGGNDSIQMRYTSHGLYTSVSAGKLFSVEVVWNTNTVNGRSINVYGSNTAFSSISTEGAESLGSITKNTSTTVVDDDFEYSYLLITGNGDALYIDKIIVTWKVEGTDNVMTADPELSLDSSSIYVGRTTTLRVTTTPVDSDEKLNVTSSDPTVATVSGSGKAYTVRGVSEGTATITVTGKQSGLSSSIDIKVNNAIKTCEDKILDDVTLELTSSYSTDAEKSLDGVTYVVNDVLKSNGLQFKSSSGYIYNSTTLFDVNDIPAAIKAVTLVMQSKNTSAPLVYEGNEKNPSSPVIVSGTFSQDGVNTYTFSGTTKYFKVAAGTNATYIEKIIVELVDSADDHLTLARSAANTILTKLGGFCGASGSGFVTPAKWQELNNALTALNLTDRAKEILRIAARNNRLNNLSQGSATIETAMYHYDACVTKFGYTPFGGITTARASFRPTVMSFSSPQNLNTSLIVIISSIVAIASFAGYFYYKKKKDN